MLKCEEAIRAVAITTPSVHYNFRSQCRKKQNGTAQHPALISLTALFIHLIFKGFSIKDRAGARLACRAGAEVARPHRPAPGASPSL